MALAPDLTIGNVQANEGSPLIFTILASMVTLETIRLRLAIVGTTAVVGTDFVLPVQYSVTGTTWITANATNDVELRPGTLTTLVKITTLATGVWAGNKTLSVSVASVLAGTVKSSSGTVVTTITGLDFGSDTIVNPSATLSVARYYLSGVSHKL